VTAKEFPVIDDNAGERMKSEIEKALNDRDSVGGVIECCAVGVPVGVGDPMFDGIENRLAAIIFGIPAVKGVEFGAGFKASKMRGSNHNDPFYYDGSTVKTKTNNHGGILGGISSGMPIIVRAAFKPTSSIGIEQDSVSLSKNENRRLGVKGRHDPCIAVRAVSCVEAATAIALLDLML
jgi:chorismate synthase